MSKRIYYFGLILLAALACCHGFKASNKVILIQPYDDFPSAQAKAVFNEIAIINPKTILREAVPLPAASFYEPRNRYKANTLLHQLSEPCGKDTVIIGLTTKDISTTKNNIADWGIMGLGYCPGNACVVSSFRLSKANQHNQFYKVALHELGHTQGLPHCKTSTCFMRDAEEEILWMRKQASVNRALRF